MFFGNIKEYFIQASDYQIYQLSKVFCIYVLFITDKYINPYVVI